MTGGIVSSGIIAHQCEVGYLFLMNSRWWTDDWWYIINMDYCTPL